MAERPVDVEHVFRELSGILPSSEQTQHALDSVRTALATSGKRRTKWLWPLSIAAALVLLATVFSFILFPSHASAADALATTLAANEGYKGWIHISSDSEIYGEKSSTVEHHSNLTAVVAAVTKTPGDTSILYRNPMTDENVDYHASTGLIRIGALGKIGADQIARDTQFLPLTYKKVFDQLRNIIKKDPEKIVRTLETLPSGETLERFDFTAAIPPNYMEVGRSDDSTVIPNAIWIDPKTKLIRMALYINKIEFLNKIETLRQNFSYGGPDITSIYDAGAPRSAKIYDNRATPETIKVLDRVMDRASVPLPDGVGILLYESKDNAYLLASERSKTHWIERRYFTDNAKPHSVVMPPDWNSVGADEFFLRLARAAPYSEIIGDPGQASSWDFTQEKVRETHSTGQTTYWLEKFSSPAWRFYPTEAFNSVYDVANHLDLMTSSDHPGLIALHMTYANLTPDSLRANFEFWIDPNHADRPVRFIEESFGDVPKVPGRFDPGRFKLITEFTSYADFSDGRSYPTRWAETEYLPNPDGSFSQTDVTKVTFHFFPGMHLPPFEIPTPSTHP